MEWTPTLQLFWITLALVNAGLAEGNNRSRWNWFLVSILLGPLATFLIVTWPRSETQVAESIPISSQEMDRS